MRAKYLVLMVLCGGCSLTPANDLEDLYVQHARCIAADAVGCEQIWASIERREQIVASRERQRACPGGTASVSNSHGPTSCVAHSDVRSVLSRMLR